MSAAHDLAVSGARLWARALNWRTSLRGARALVLLGQSNATNVAVGWPYWQRSRGIWMLDLGSGGLYPASEPLAGVEAPGTTSFMLRLADELTARSARPLVLASAAVGGSSVAQWASGGEYCGRVDDIADALDALALPVLATLWVQGETDCGLGTTTESYSASLADVIARLRARGLARPESPLYVPVETYSAGRVSASVQCAQRAAPDGRGVLPGPNLDMLGAQYRQIDDVHFASPRGTETVARLWLEAMRP